MKKLISLLLALAMIACIAAGCTNTADNNDADKNNTTETTEDTVSTENNDDVENNEDIENGESTGTMEELVNKIMEKNPVEFMGMAMALDLTETNTELEWQIQSFTGLANANDVSDVAVYEAMMGSIAFSLVAVRVNEGVDAKTVGQAMKDGIDTRKWICVGADQLMVAGCGDIVMLIMLDNANLGLTAQSYVDAFKDVCGADLSFTL